MHLDRTAVLIGFIVILIVVGVTFYLRSLSHSQSKPQTLSSSILNDNTDYNCAKCNQTFTSCAQDISKIDQCKANYCSCLKSSNCSSYDAVCTDAPVPSGDLTSCESSDGNWKTADNKLNSPCCQPPHYDIPSSYTTCSNKNSESDPAVKKCLSECCAYRSSQLPFMDSTWSLMSDCGCALCCKEQAKGNSHFTKYGTCVQYIQGEPASATTDDSQESGTGGDWRGWIGYKS
jgi:hypothetical protein